MYNVPFQVDLSNKVVAVTGAGGIICSEFAKALAACGAKVALLDINYDAAKKYADEIGENALAVKCNCLDKASIEEAKREMKRVCSEALPYLERYRKLCPSQREKWAPLLYRIYLELNMGPEFEEISTYM